jgi:hypothetical protein
MKLVCQIHPHHFLHYPAAPHYLLLLLLLVVAAAAAPCEPLLSLCRSHCHCRYPGRCQD